MPQMILQYHLAGIVQRGAHCRQLHQHLRAIAALLHHPLDLFQMSEGAGETVDYRLLIFVDMPVAVGNAMGMHIGMIVIVMLHFTASFSVFLHYIPCAGFMQAREGVISQNVLTESPSSAIIIGYVPKLEEYPMRMRKMKNLDPRMERCAALRITEPAAQKGIWQQLKPDCTALWVEVGCGKGKFTAETAAANPDVLLIAVERCREAMVVAMEKAQAMGLTNVFYIDMDVANIEEIFAPGEIDRLFINFPDPWPRKKNAKRRLTHRGFLDKYCRVVRTGGEFHFKTDNAPLFEFSVEEFAACGLEVKNLTRNLHENGIVGIMTGYEEKFHALGTPINRCEVVCKPFLLPPEEKKTTTEEV